MQPIVEILQLSESFAQVWEKLVSSAGGCARLHQDPGTLPGGKDACGAIISAAGAEESALALVERVVRAGRPVAVVGAAADHRLVLSLVKQGADDYFILPDDLSALRVWVQQRVEAEARVGRAHELARSQQTRFDFSQLIGRSPGMREALEQAGKVVPWGSATVLITGETGTGKELVARAIHYNGPRASKPFVEINCVALPANLLEAELFGYEAGAFTDARVAKPGLLEAADGGTLFLDEIGDLSLELQGKLLRVLETKRVRRLGALRDQPVDVRILAATHVDLEQSVAQGRFRGDLYFRLNVLSIHLPPLRERGEDVLLLAEHFAGRLAAEHHLARPVLSGEVRRALLAHPWPGNVRELRNAVERAMMLGDGELRAGDLFVRSATPAQSAGSGIPFPASLERIEAVVARETVEFCRGNKSEAARILGVSRRHLYALLERAAAQ